MLNSNMDDVTASNQHRPISCVHEERERDMQVLDIYAQVCQNPPTLIFLEG